MAWGRGLRALPLSGAPRPPAVSASCWLWGRGVVMSSFTLRARMAHERHERRGGERWGRLERGHERRLSPQGVGRTFAHGRRGGAKHAPSLVSGVCVHLASSGGAERAPHLRATSCPLIPALLLLSMCIAMIRWGPRSSSSLKPCPSSSTSSTVRALGAVPEWVRPLACGPPSPCGPHCHVVT